MNFISIAFVIVTVQHDSAGKGCDLGLLRRGDYVGILLFQRGALLLGVLFAKSRWKLFLYLRHQLGTESGQAGLRIRER